MGLLLLEVLGALGLAIFIVWWTMFSGRPGGERRSEAEGEAGAGPQATPAPRGPDVRDQPPP